MKAHKTSKLIARLVPVIVGAVLATHALPSAMAAVTASTGYTVSVFAPAPPGLSNPDSITMGDGSIFVTYANNATATGSSGSSTVVEFSTAGQVITNFTVQGKNDGLKFNPYDHKLWAVRNEDGNPALTLINPETGVSTDLTFATAPVHGGGYDDVAFLNGKIYITASNPTVDTNGQNHFPSIVKAKIVGTQVEVTPVLFGDAILTDIATAAPAVSAQSDPDSLKVGPFGTLVMDSQADGDLIFVSHPGSCDQSAQLLHLSNGTTNQITVDDTVFPTSPSGTILLVDTKGNTVYAVQSAAFQVAGAYSASDSDGALGKVDLSTGVFTPIVTGMGTPHGALFVPAAPCKEEEETH
jgi:hypothetical protein